LTGSHLYEVHRRINALKLMREIPEVQIQIEKGELNLSSLSVAQSFFRTDAAADKKEVLAALKNKTKKRGRESGEEVFSQNA